MTCFGIFIIPSSKVFLWTSLNLWWCLCVTVLQVFLPITSPKLQTYPQEYFWRWHNKSHETCHLQRRYVQIILTFLINLQLVNEKLELEDIIHQQNFFKKNRVIIIIIKIILNVTSWDNPYTSVDIEFSMDPGESAVHIE